MKLKYLSLAAALFVGFFTACDDSGSNATDSIASYDTLPKFCDEGDTVKLTSNSALFYCKNGDWLEVGLIVPTATSSSSTAEVPKSSETKNEDIESSEDSKPESSSSEESTEKKSSSSTATETKSSRDPVFAGLDKYVYWKDETPRFDDGDRSATLGILREQYTDARFAAAVKEMGFRDAGINMLSASNLKLLEKQINITAPTLSEYRTLFVKKVSDGDSKSTSYFIAGPADPLTAIYGYIEIGIYNGDLEKIIDNYLSKETICGDLWCGPKGDDRVMTGLDAFGSNYLTGTSGYWYAYTDEKDGGESAITWPVKPGNTYANDALSPVINHCKGLCGTVDLQNGNFDYKPFAGVGFDIAGQTSNTDNTLAAADASGWLGICVVYTSDVSTSVSMGLGAVKDAKLRNNQPHVDLEKTDKRKVANFLWTDFKQYDWNIADAESITGAEAAKQLITLKIHFQDEAGSYSFNIVSIGTYGSCKAIEKTSEGN